MCSPDCTKKSTKKPAESSLQCLMQAISHLANDAAEEAANLQYDPVLTLDRMTKSSDLSPPVSSLIIAYFATTNEFQIEQMYEGCEKESWYKDISHWMQLSSEGGV